MHRAVLFSREKVVGPMTQKQFERLRTELKIKLKRLIRIIRISHNAEIVYRCSNHN